MELTEEKLKVLAVHPTHKVIINVDTLKVRCLGCPSTEDVLDGMPDFTGHAFAQICHGVGLEIPTGVLVTITGVFDTGIGADEDPEPMPQDSAPRQLLLIA